MGQYGLTVTGMDYNNYELSITNSGNNGTSKIQIFVQIMDDPFPGNLSADQIADAIRDWVATLPNYGSSTLERVEMTRTVV